MYAQHYEPTSDHRPTKVWPRHRLQISQIPMFQFRQQPDVVRVPLRQC